MRNFQQLGIELHERMFDGCILLMTFPALVFARRVRACRLGGLRKIEVGPLVREARFVFYFHVQARQFRLIAAMLVDRAARSRPIYFQHEHGLIRPLSVDGEIVVRRWRDENVCEHLSSTGTLAVTHSVSRGHKYPLPIPGGTYQLALGSELRRWVLWLLGSYGVEGQRSANQHESAEKDNFLHRASVVRRALFIQLCRGTP